MANVSIRVEGFDELRQGLRNIDADLGKELGRTNRTVGAKVAAWSESSRSSMAARFPSYRSRAVTVKPSANQRRVMVSVRPAAAEYGTDRHPVFGRWQSQATFSRKVWPLSSRDGWLVAPTIARHESAIADDYLAAVGDLAARVVDTTTN